jgi:hypothetical protein
MEKLIGKNEHIKVKVADLIHPYSGKPANTSNAISRNYVVRVPVIIEYHVEWFDDERPGKMDGDRTIVIDKDGNVTGAGNLLYNTVYLDYDNSISSGGDVMFMINSVDQVGDMEVIDGPDLEETYKNWEIDKACEGEEYE